MSVAWNWHGSQADQLPEHALKLELERLSQELLRLQDQVAALERRGKAFEVRASVLSDACGELRRDNDHLMLENARLRRRLGE